jgi:hypothetical protein
MAKTKSTAPNFRWTCNYPECGASKDGFDDVDLAAADAGKHYGDEHAGGDVSPNFTYENLNPADVTHTPRRDLHEIWADIPDDTPLTKKDLAEFFDMGG